MEPTARNRRVRAAAHSETLPTGLMTDVGTQEQKRLQRAVPDALSAGTAGGCVWAIAGYAAFCLWMYRRSGWLGWVLLAAPALIIATIALIHAAYGIALLAVARFVLEPRGVRCLLVHSDSPIWEPHISATWLPRFGRIATRLNWSERASWNRSIDVMLFRHFCKGPENFNPVVLVFRGLRRPLVFRFFYAFHEAKHGRTEYLAMLEGQMFTALRL
jgi:hypothetical protein